MCPAQAEAAEPQASAVQDENDIIIQAGQEFNARHPWVVEQIREFATKGTPDHIHCSWLYGKTVVVANTVDYDLPMHVVYIGNKRLAIVDDPSKEMLDKLKRESFDAIALATNGRADPEHPRSKRVPGDERNHIEEALISLIDDNKTLFIDPDFRKR